MTVLLRSSTFTKNQVVYKEGEISEYIYFIKKGEFKMYKQILEESQTNEHFLYGSLFIPKSQKKKLILISTIQEGEMFGVEDGDNEGNGTR